MLDDQTEGSFTLELSDPQYDFLESKHKHTGFVAGFGSGKSFIGTLKTLLKIINDEVPKVAYYLPTYGDIRDIAFDGFPSVCEILGYDYKLNKSDKEFKVFGCDGEVLGVAMFRNMSEPESIVGYQVGYSLIDETDILKRDIMDKAFKKILGRNRLIMPVTDKDTLQRYTDTNIIEDGYYIHKEKKVLCHINSIDVAGTPEGFKWFHKRFVENRTDSDLLIKASTYSNLHNLPDDFIDTLRAEYPEELFQAYVNGDFVNLTTGTIYSYFKRSQHDTNEDMEDGEQLFIGQDFNIGGCVSIVYVKRGDSLVAVDEYESYDTRTIILNTNIRYQDRPISFIPDASGNAKKTSASETDIQLLRQAGFGVLVNNSNPAVKDRINTTNNLIEKGRFRVNTKKCPNFTKALEQHAYDDKGQPEKFNGAGTVDDYTDAGTYPAAYIFPIRQYATIKGGFNR